MLHDLLAIPRALRPAMAAGSGGGAPRRIAVAALSLDESAEISVRAARAPNFLLFDDAGRLQEVVPNPHATLADHVAEKVAGLLEEKNVRLFIAGELGPEMTAQLERRGIHHIQDMGLANIAVAAHRDD